MPEGERKTSSSGIIVSMTPIFASIVRRDERRRNQFWHGLCSLRTESAARHADEPIVLVDHVDPHWYCALWTDKNHVFLAGVCCSSRIVYERS